MIQIKQILVAFDGSEHSLKALDHAKIITKNNDAQLTVVYVLEANLDPISVAETPHGEEYVYHPHIYTGMVTSGRLNEERRKLDLKNELADKVINIAQSKLLDIGNVRYKKMFGNPAKEIIDYANENDKDLIVIGNRGIGTIKKLIMGSVSQKVVNDAECSVYVVK